MRITPVILSGGSGTRLWPMSRDHRPKQFLALTGDSSMFAETIARVADHARFTAPIVVANAVHVALIEEDVGDEPATLLLEPSARNTAPAIALAALAGADDALLLVMPSDHVVTDVDAFLAAIDAATPLAQDGWLVTFGITPDAPETGYGYIAMGTAVAPGVNRVAQFVEKPDRPAAEAMLSAGGHVWNAGIFLFRADAYLAALATYAPEMRAAAAAAMAGAETAGQHILPDAAAFARSPAQSIDYAVMEKAEKVAVVPVAMGWSDIGSWDALYALQCDDTGHAHRGDVIAIDTSGCLIHSDGIRVAAVGVSDLLIVASGDAVLVMPRGTSQDVKRVVAAIKATSEA